MLQTLNPGDGCLRQWRPSSFTRTRSNNNCPKYSSVSFMGKKKISLALTLISTLQVLRCHGDYLTCFRFVISTFSTVYYSDVLECYLCCRNLRSLFSSTTWWKHTSFTLCLLFLTFTWRRKLMLTLEVILWVWVFELSKEDVTVQRGQLYRINDFSWVSS